VKYMVYRDSLIFEASKYKISLGINQDKWNPSNEWILSMIHSTKERLNSGQNDISSQIVSVISDLIERNITPPKAKKEKKYTILPMLSNLSKKDQTPVNDDFFIADFVFKVNEGGLITDVYVANSPSNTSKNEYFNTHVQNIIQITKGLLVFPFKGQDGLNYPSVAKLTVQIWMGVKVYQTPRKGV